LSADSTGAASEAPSGGYQCAIFIEGEPAALRNCEKSTRVFVPFWDSQVSEFRTLHARCPSTLGLNVNHAGHHQSGPAFRTIHLALLAFDGSHKVMAIAAGVGAIAAAVAFGWSAFSP
jgi:hypothetical protein